MSGERWLALDGLRGVAILLVVAAHAHVVSAPVGGMVGVTLFFVLSGFLITNLLIEEVETTGRLELKSFYARRALRLLPALAVYLVGITMALIVLDIAVPVVETLLPPALYSSNYAQILGMDLHAHRHTWSLAVEEHFYVVWPILVGLGATRRTRVLAGAVVALIAWRLFAASVDPVWAYMGTDTNAYALGVGALLASARRESHLPVATTKAVSLSVAGLAFLSLVQVHDVHALYEASTWVTIVASLLAAVAVWASVSTGETSFLCSSPLRWFGLISYSLYLWHAPIIRLPGIADSRTSRLLGVALSVTIAWASWVLIEGPIMKSRVRRRFARSPRPTLGAAAGASSEMSG